MRYAPRSHTYVPSPSPSPVCGTEDLGSVRLGTIENSPEKPAAQNTYTVNVRPNLWEEARARLSDEDRAWVDKTIDDSSTPVHNTVNRMINLATEKQRECETSGWKTVSVGSYEISFEEVTSNIIIWLNKFKEVGDTLVQYDPAHAALPWAAVRFILRAAISTKEQMAASLAVLEKATRIIHRCQVFEEVYNRTTVHHVVIEDLESSLIQLYGRPSAGSSLLESLEGGEAQVDQQVIACEAHRKAENDTRFKMQLNDLLKLSEPVLRIDKNVEKMLQQLESEELSRISKWISPLTFQLHHNIIKESRTEDTCDWLIRRPKFSQWSSATSSTTLWLQGFPGSGKTFLTSKVIDNIKATLHGKENDESFAFFYCNRNEENRRHALDVLRSYIRQLSTTSHKSGFIYAELKQFYDDCQLRGSGWTLGVCKEHLIKLLNLYPRTILVLDALDECWPEERASLLDFFDSIPRKSSKPVKIFISSRPESDLRQRLIHLSNIDIQATDNGDDIAKFVRKSIDRNGNWIRVLRQNELLKDEIVQTLLTQSNGMFQWAMLQIKQLLTLGTEGEIRSRLGKLPKTLKAAYDEIFENIEALEADAGTMSLAALRWVMCAHKPLTSEALLAAININPEQETFGSFETAEDDLLGWAGHLLRIDTQQNPPVWRVSHLSVAEYLETHWTILQAHCYVAKASLLLMRETYRGKDEQPKIMEPDILHESHRLQIYVRYNWAYHAQTQEDQYVDPKLADLLKAFLGSLEESSVHYRGWRLQILSDGMSLVLLSSLPIVLFDALPSTYAAPLPCYFSFYNLLRDWWDNASLESLLEESGDGYGFLELAVAGGCMPICLRLCELGLPVNIAYQKWGKLVLTAAQRGLADIVRFLVDKGAEIYQPLQGSSYNYGSALEAAIVLGYIDTVRVLVDKGADINQSYGFCHSSPLEAAVRRGHIDIIRFLIDKGADINKPLQGKRYGSALAAAVQFRYTNIVRLLVDKGANINQPLYGCTFNSALATAAGCGHIDIMQLLINKGAAINQPLHGCTFNSALATAAGCGHIDIVQLLVDQGADINQLCRGHYSSALAAAAGCGRLDIVQLLVNQGADINRLCGGYYGSALAAAAGCGHIDIVRFLVNKGADINQLLHGCTFNSALAAAAEIARLDVVRFLVERGAFVNMPGQTTYRSSALYIAASAFYIAARKEHLDIVQFLVDEGAVLNVSSLTYGALDKGGTSRHRKVVKLLISKGAVE
ncbi:hypothetical protein RRF57_003444 [Xylaria bambusicola]|uniref:Nephrocystin 3-like N-terminal domain-containing protein n=1 Tax=Xylaria bambusicola TaxID=326684 RepID=A0AAN7UES4_9PEZI